MSLTVKRLCNALVHAFSHSLGFICAVHSKKNICEKMTEIGLSKTLQQIIKDVKALKKKWNKLEAAQKKHPSFVSYFEKHKQQDIKDHMRIKLSQDASFGD